MPVHNADIAVIFGEIADILELESANPFRIRAYRNAARAVIALTASLASDEDLTALPAIGKDLATKIAKIVETGKCQALEKLRKEAPAGVTDLTNSDVHSTTDFANLKYGVGQTRRSWLAGKTGYTQYPIPCAIAQTTASHHVTHTS